MGQPREVARRGRQADPDEADVVVGERTRRRDGHHLDRRPAHDATSADRKDVLGDPGPERSAIARDGVPRDVERVVARVVAVRVRRPGAARGDRDGGHRPRRQHDGVGAGARQRVHDLFDRDQRPPGGEHRFLLHADDAFEQHVAVTVGLLRVHDRDVGPVRRDGGEPLAGERAVDEPDVRVHGGEIRSHVSPEERRRHVRRSGGIGVGHRRMAVLFELDRPRPAALDGIAQAVERPDAGVAAPREDQALRQAAPDHLVVEQVGRHPDERELADALADHLVARGEGDQVREPLERHGIARAHQSGHGVVQAEKLAHLGGGDYRTSCPIID